MIPKIIHYVWIGSDVPETIIECIKSWKRLMPDYKYIHWDNSKIQNIDNLFLKQALVEKKWAFVADFVRLYAIYNYGGIYLDTDVILYKSFDNLLSSSFFIGRENSIHITGGRSEVYLTSHCFGAEKGHSFIKNCLSYYDRPFVMSTNRNIPTSLRLNITIIPYILSEFAEQYGYNSRPTKNKIQYLTNGMIVYPSTFFDCTKVTKDSYCKHLAVGSWREKHSKTIKYNIKYKIKWRIIAFFQYILKKFNYILIELD